MRQRKRNLRPWLFITLAAAGLAALIAAFLIFFEGEDPSVSADLPTPYVSGSRDIPVSVSDTRSGLRKIRIAILKDGHETVLHEEDLPSAGLLRRGQVREKTVDVRFDPAALQIADGEATLDLKVWDYSWRGWWHGNSTSVEKPIVIDTAAPGIDVLSRAHNINQGGSGLVVYRLSEPCDEDGVQVGDRFYPGHAGYFENQAVKLALVAVSDTQGTDTEMTVRAVDPAGNTAKAGFYYHIRDRQFRNDTINISDGFLKAKLPEFAQELSVPADASGVDKFLKINRDLRRENYQTIVEITGQSEDKMLWEGEFGRLPGAASRAGFGDRRRYLYKGKEIDRQTHLGIDLASLANSPVPAANSGMVVFSDHLGIYGRTIIIDHGFGLFSMYSHLSQLAVNKDDKVKNDTVIGRTGRSGLAGGDHLHFSMLVNGTFVNPIEWWDGHWIRDNVTDKLAEVRRQLAQEKSK